MSKETHKDVQDRDALESVVLQITNELQRARRSFPEWPDDPLHAIAIIVEELGELQRAALHRVYEPEKSIPGNLREEALQAGAMCMRFLLNMDRYVWSPADHHADAAPDTRTKEQEQ